MTPKIAANVAWQIVDGEAIVIDLASGTTIGLNPTATFLWSQIDGARDAAAIAAALSAEFDVESSTAGDDTREFLELMQSRAFVVEAGSEAPAEARR